MLRSRRCQVPEAEAQYTPESLWLPIHRP
jgi:hypothetical protein